MHNNYYFFKHLVPALSAKLSGATLINCFTQNKNELILEFIQTNQEQFFIKASLESQFSCLSFPANYHRAKRNSANIFELIRGKKLLNIKNVLNERAFIFDFEKSNQLLFKLYGNQSNIILFKNNNAANLFKSALKRDNEIDINELDRTLDISFTALKESGWNTREIIPTLDKHTAQLLSDQLTNSIDKEQAFNDFINELTDSKFYIDYSTSGYRLNLIKTDLAQATYTNPILAITSFFEQEVKLKSITSIKSKLIKPINSQLLKSDNYVKKLTKKLNELSTGSNNRQKADILMANLHAIAKGSKSVELFDFYTNSPIIINLNPLQTPQKNAERYYRKAKNEAKEIAVLTNNIKQKKKIIKELTSKLIAVENSYDYKFLQNQLPKKAIAPIEEPKAYKEFRIDGFVILVGKNAKHNDTLTLKIAKKDDLWLHAKDVSGSHVVIKQIPGKNYPQYIIEKAAQLAAYYSKRKTDSLCPVLYTPKKYVRKKKGTPAGAMFVEKEKVILVEPSNEL
ncbi:MAG: NFACT RNA binding domain-containing protein [Cyclobacteriaceae bacterium]|nr:NFACT RNA binding domain-containing protein [Cyclobacteriaceae bacterium]